MVDQKSVVVHSRLTTIASTLLFRIVVYGTLALRCAAAISVPSPPTMIKQPPSEDIPFSVAATRDGRIVPVKLDCEATGNPEPTYKWIKNGRQFDFWAHDNRMSLQPGRGTLVIIDPRLEDEGFYHCEATNEYGTSVSNSVFVKKLVVPYWVTAPNNTIASFDESVRFDCKAFGDPEPVVEWFVNGVELSRAPHNPRRKLVSPTVMTIDMLLRTDTAVYQCNASNTFGYTFRDFYLNVITFAPEMTDPPEALYESVDGASVTLRCRVFGAPHPEVRWIRGGGELTGGRYIVQQNGDLHIAKTLSTDTGRYKCIAENKFGRVESDDSLGHLEVRERTRISAEHEDYEVPAGQSATLRCNIVSDLDIPLVVEWQVNGQTIDFDGELRMYVGADMALTISETIELDSGVYTCIAKTELYTRKAQVTLVVQDRPNPPRLVGVECKQKTAIVKWQPMGDNRARILSYIIQYNTSFTPEVWDVVKGNMPSSELKFEVSLSPWANYSFRVIARNKIDKSLPSLHSSVCETPPDVPYSNPEKVQGQGTTPSNLVISWTLMRRIEHNGPGFFYRVFWKRANTGMDWQIHDIGDWQQVNLLVDNQPTYQPYNIKVEAHNMRGQANVAAVEIIGHSGEDRPQLSPQNLGLFNLVDANTAILDWNPVPPDSVRGHFKGYKIQTWTKDEGLERLREMVVPANVTSSTVELFIPFSQNYVRVLVFNGRYDGPPSAVIAFRTPEGKPGPVSSLDAVPIGSSALRLTWSRPTEPNGILIGYRIFYQKIGGPDFNPITERYPPVENPNVTIAMLVGLENRTRYRIIVKASTAAGLGFPSHVEVSTGDASNIPPGKPSFKWTWLELTDGQAGAMVTRIPKFEGNIGNHFYVEYRQKGKAQWQKTDDVLDDESVAVTGLLPGTTYEMRLVAVAGILRAWSDVEEIETSDAVVSASLARTTSFIHSESMEGNVNIEVVWTRKMMDIAGRLFYVRYRQKTKNEWKTMNRVPIDRSFTITGLKPRTVYEIEVIEVD